MNVQISKTNNRFYSSPKIYQVDESNKFNLCLYNWKSLILGRVQICRYFDRIQFLFILFIFQRIQRMVFPLCVNTST